MPGNDTILEYKMEHVTIGLIRYSYVNRLCDLVDCTPSDQRTMFPRQKTNTLYETTNYGVTYYQSTPRSITS
jgi:hypothetical protein